MVHHTHPSGTIPLLLHAAARGSKVYPSEQRRGPSLHTVRTDHLPGSRPHTTACHPAADGFRASRGPIRTALNTTAAQCLGTLPRPVTAVWGMACWVLLSTAWQSSVTAFRPGCIMERAVKQHGTGVRFVPARGSIFGFPTAATSNRPSLVTALCLPHGRGLQICGTAMEVGWLGQLSQGVIMLALARRASAGQLRDVGPVSMLPATTPLWVPLKRAPALHCSSLLTLWPAASTDTPTRLEPAVGAPRAEPNAPARRGHGQVPGRGGRVKERRRRRDRGDLPRRRQPEVFLRQPRPPAPPARADQVPRHHVIRNPERRAARDLCLPWLFQPAMAGVTARSPPARPRCWFARCAQRGLLTMNVDKQSSTLRCVRFTPQTSDDLHLAPGFTVIFTVNVDHHMLLDGSLCS